MSESTASSTSTPWHGGELQMQRAAGAAAERMSDIGRLVIRDHLIDQHRQFYPLLPFVVLGAVDEAGDAWASLRAGRPGFLAAPDEHRLNIATARDAVDPAEGGLTDGAAVGLLGIDLGTRRRNRLNGTIVARQEDSFAIRVGQSYGNCPKYIQLRAVAFARDTAEPAAIAPLQFDRLDGRARQMIEAADAFFVTSYVDREGGAREVDVSHRGGRPGFVRIDADGGLTIPDFAGNQFFNTLGNFTVNPRAGLVFVDFETGDLLQLSGDAEVLLDSPEIAAFRGAERLWWFRPRHIVYRAGALPLRWASAATGASPYALATGNWHEAAPRPLLSCESTDWMARTPRWIDCRR